MVSHQSLYKAFKPTISQEALKSLDQSEKDLVASEFTLTNTLFIALQLLLHIVLTQSVKMNQTIRKLAAQYAKLADAAGVKKEGDVSDAKMDSGNSSQQESINQGRFQEEQAATKEWLAVV